MHYILTVDNPACMDITVHNFQRQNGKDTQTSNATLYGLHRVYSSVDVGL